LPKELHKSRQKTQKQWGQKRIGESAASKPVEYYTKENGQDPTRDHLKNTLIEKSFLVTFSLAN
jgi:hypothetical protein